MMCEWSDGNGGQCRGEDDEKVVGSYCGAQTDYRVRHFIYDFEHDRLGMEVDEVQDDDKADEPTPRVQVVQQQSRVTYYGAGCDHSEQLVR